jgi:hypothetical protein
MGGACPELGGDLIKLLSVLPGLLPPGRVAAAARVANLKMRAETTFKLNDSTILNCGNNMGILDIVPVK